MSGPCRVCVEKSEEIREILRPYGLSAYDPIGGIKILVQRFQYAAEVRENVDANEMSAAWWRTDGSYIDPDTEDVDWFDKRSELAKIAFIAGYNAATVKP